MFHIKRVFKTNPGQARKVATLAYKAAETFKEAGQRGEFGVYFNAGTTPGEKNIVVLEWTDGSIKSVFRGENELPAESLNQFKEILSLCEDSWVEFNELLTPDKMTR